MRTVLAAILIGLMFAAHANEQHRDFSDKTTQTTDANGNPAYKSR
jgi:hypothetical protein